MFEDVTWGDGMGWCGLDWSGSGQEQVERSCDFCKCQPVFVLMISDD
jgi:hypothetical protein